MKTQRPYPAFTVTKKAEASIKAGHPWVYDAEITYADECENGSVVDVFSQKGSWLGAGLLSTHSKIRVRLLSRNANDDFGYEFFARRIGYAIDYRLTVMGDDFSSCRLVFGEADGLPGLTVDKYEDILSTQVLSYGMEMRKDMIFSALTDELRARGVNIRGIFERNDVAIRELEGLDEHKGWYSPDSTSAHESACVDITENGIMYTVDVENGQKTGFFLDQKYNRLAVAKIAKGKKVLDCFTHTGSFALNAAKGGAAHVTAVDVSQIAVDMARANAARNGLDKNMDFICADVFELLPKLCEEHADYDFIILDPPAFTKSRKTVGQAGRGYKEINFRAMKLLPRGGYLATCSCSHFMPQELFLKTVASAAADAGVQLKLIEARRQSPDHPTLLDVAETDYLKFYLFQII
ncbi:MAG: class I SAM-dependent rRNA methyltransferase [Clostridia bacterium]|nr:class I SAM-dependent rRNA methyltransferase [Clostridia bacterium]